MMKRLRALRKKIFQLEKHLWLHASRAELRDDFRDRRRLWLSAALVVVERAFLVFVVHDAEPENAAALVKVIVNGFNAECHSARRGNLLNGVCSGHATGEWPARSENRWPEAPRSQVCRLPDCELPFQ